MKKISLGLLVVFLIVAGYLAADYYRASPDKIEARYIGRDSCAQCHQPQMVAFEGSDHDLAMDLATEQTVLADFNNQSLEHYGVTSKMFRDGDKFMVRTDGRDGEMHDYEVKYVFGVHPLQQYMVELDRPSDAKTNEVGRVQVLRLSWDTKAQKWFYLMPPDVDEKILPGDPLHWTGITQNWNASCATCHSTDVHKNFSPHSGEYRTTFSEIDVSCEACHGPASYHVDLAKRRSLFWDRNHGFGLAKLKTESNVAQVEACAPCHSRRTAMSESYRAGCNFDDYYATQVITDPIYHIDGQIRDEDYVYGSFIQSKMYHKGVKCSDCHDPHSTQVKFTDNKLCTSCHLGQHSAGKYDTPNHHHHEPGKPGSFCVDCHMPATTYMMLDHRRDHSFRVPRPDMSLDFGTPNACSGCHLDESKIQNRTSTQPLKQYLDWIIAAESGDQIVQAELNRTNKAMQAAIEQWYPEQPENERTQYYRQLAEGLFARPGNRPANDQPAKERDAATQKSVITLARLANDRSAPAMIRASALTGLAGDTSNQSFEAAKKALSDSDPKVVAAALLRMDAEIGVAADRLRYAQSQDDVTELFLPIANAIVPLFGHTSRRVRTEAARVFATIDENTRRIATTPRQRSDFDNAVSELESALQVENDRAASHMMLGGLHEMLGRPEDAKNDYRMAIAAEPNLAGPRSNLAALLDAETESLRRNMRSMQQGQTGGVQANQLRNLLRNIQTNQQKVAELRAQEHLLLEQDIQRSEGLADTHGLHYRFAMSAFLQRDFATTEKHLQIAHQQRPDIPTYLLGLATYYVQIQDPTQAMPFIDKLIEIDPNHEGYRNLKTAALNLAEEAPSNDR